MVVMYDSSVFVRLETTVFCLKMKEKAKAEIIFLVSKPEF